MPRLLDHYRPLFTFGLRLDTAIRAGQPRGSVAARRRGSLAVVSAYPDGAPADQHASAAPSTGATP